MANTNFFIFQLSKEIRNVLRSYKDEIFERGNCNALCPGKDRILGEGIHCLYNSNMISLSYE